MSEADDLRQLIVDDVEALTGVTIAPGPYPPSSTPYAAFQGLAEALVTWRLGRLLSWKHRARVATNDVLPPCTYMSGALIGTGALPPIDGVTLAADDRVLVWLQVDETQNGIYEVASLDPWILARSDDANTGDQLLGAIVLILEGDSAAQAYRCTATGTVTLGTTALEWVPWPPAPSVPTSTVSSDEATGSVTTTDNTPTNVESHTPPHPCCIQVEADVVGFDAGDAEGGSWRGLVATFRVDGAGVVTQIGTTWGGVASTDAGWTADIVTDGTIISVQVTGELGATIAWKSFARFRIVDAVSDVDGATGKVTTADSTTTDLESFAPPASCCIQVTTNVVAFEPGGPLGGSWSDLVATFRVDGGGAVTQIGTTWGGVNAEEDPWAADIDTDGSVIRVRATGIAATTIVWKSYTHLRVVS